MTTPLDLIREALFEVAPKRRAEFADLKLTAKITELALDSIAIMEMVGFIEDRLEHTFEEEELAEVKTVGDLANLIGAAKAVA
jgi:acyl carrier protein